MPDVRLSESTPLVEAASGGPKGRRFRARIIQGDIQGSSGFYPSDMLRKHAAVFREGLPVFLDHPGITEAYERPERSVRDLAGRLVTEARYERDGLYADVEVYPHFAPLIEAMADHIGMSIRASGTVEPSMQENIRGPMVTSLTEATSVDFVTAAGAGGKLVQLLESARAMAEGRHSARGWDEQKHPRADNGKFGHGSGGGTDGGGPGSSGSGGGDHGGGSSGGADSKGDRPGRGMPHVLTSTDVQMQDGSSLKLERDLDNKIHLANGNRKTTLSKDQANKLASQVDLADDWDTGDEDSFDGMHLKKTGRNEYQATLPDGATLNLTRKDGQKLGQSLEQLHAASRVDTGNGDVDVFAPNRKTVGLRHIGDDGHPVEVEFKGPSARKITNIIDEIIDDIDLADTPEDAEAARRKTVSTNAGKINIELSGDWNKPGGKLKITPVDASAPWGLVIDGPHQSDFYDAFADAGLAAGLDFDEARRRGISREDIHWFFETARTMVEAKVSDTSWSDFSQADYDIAQWRKACLVGPAETSEDKADYSLPVREPDGTLNRNAVHAAASRVGQLKGAPGQKQAAAKKLVSLYGQLEEDPPESLTKLAGDDTAKPADGGKAKPPWLKTTKEAAAMAPAKGPNVGAWLESRLHLACTQLTDDMYGSGRLTRPERLSLSSAIGDGLKAFTTRLEADQPQLYERGLYDGPDPGPLMSEATRALLVEAHGMTANDLRDALCDATKETYGGKDIYTWVRDYTDEWLVFSLESETESALYQQPYAVDETTQAVTLSGEPVEVRSRTTYVPEPQATGDPPEDKPVPNKAPVTKNAPGTKPADTTKIKEGRMPELTEEQARQLEEAASNRTQLDEAIARLNEATGHIQTLTERADAADARAEASDAKTLRLENEKAARAAVTEALKTSGLPATSHARVTESVCRDLPTNEGGTLDVTKLGEAITAAIDDKKAELAEALESAGVGSVRDLGESARADLSESDIDKQLAEAFAGIGLDERAALTAAHGRG